MAKNTSPQKDGQQTVSIGLLSEVPIDDISAFLANIPASGHDFVAVNIMDPRHRQPFYTNEKGSNGEEGQVPEDYIDAKVREFAKHFDRKSLLIKDADWSDYMVGVVANWLQLDSPLHRIRTISELLLKKQFAWASHIGLSSLLLPLPLEPMPTANYARCLNSLLGGLTYTQAWIRVPLLPPASSRKPSSSSTATELSPPPGLALEDDASSATWQRWNLLRLLCDHTSKLRIALEITPDLPNDAVLERWFSEPLSAAIIPTDVFVSNAKGYPVLSKRHQTFVKKLIKHKCTLMIANPDSESALPMHPNGPSVYADYIRHLALSLPSPSMVEKFATGYQDYLQAPLQPLADNLEAATYATFEKDPVKYELYEEAVYRALTDRVSEEQVKNGKVTVVMVVGAGAKGPLVNCCLRASERSGRQIKAYAVEKNPNALVTLQAMKSDIWGDQVTIVHSDMRRWNAPEKADILVSELLGSFGDNELSPECLDGAQKFLNEDGISIPESCTAYIAPLSSSKLYSEVAAYKDQAHFETPYVVMFKNVVHISQPEPCWSFVHPNRKEVVEGVQGDNLHNTRYSQLSFIAEEEAMLHGLAGYFEAVLYRDVMLSILPRTHSPGMFSWFPIFFPLKTPIHIPVGTTIETYIWRLTDTSKVWYEWSVVCRSPSSSSSSTTLLTATGIINVGGRSAWIGL